MNKAGKAYIVKNGSEAEQPGRFKVSIKSVQPLKPKQDQEGRKEEIQKEPTDKDEKPEKEKVKPAPMYELFRYSDGNDKCLIIFGFIGSSICGCFWPAWSYMFGKILENLNPHDPDYDAAKKGALIFCCIGVGAYILAPFLKAPFSIIAERMNVRFRIAVMKSLLNQEPGWYDT